MRCQIFISHIIQVEQKLIYAKQHIQFKINVRLDFAAIISYKCKQSKHHVRSEDIFAT